MEPKDHPENPVFGRKVFFLNPQYSVQKVVIPQLQDMEYEIYVINDYREAKNILRHYPDAICFVNIDEGLAPDQWFNFIMSFSIDPMLKSIFIGIISERSRKADRDHFLLHATIPAGFIQLTGRLEDQVETLKGILEINGAKGRRQYVRANCSKDPSCGVIFTMNGIMYKLKMLDISSVGTACILPLKSKDLLQVNSVIRDMTLTLGDKQMQCSAAVFALKESSDSITMVLLFMKGTSFTVKSIIRQYVFKSLENTMESVIQGEALDSTDYSAPVRSSSRKTEDAFLLDDTDDTAAAGSSKGGTANAEQRFVPPPYTGSKEDLSMTSLF